ncbi:uncharacterized protein LOC134262885 [Saccostrea cucullata]|uniref:uncharacterized protein LOC134262885 n=1 Tax=Saccostrea cuccullata TaxID=36930 RepID=UPI002ED0E4A2
MYSSQYLIKEQTVMLALILFPKADQHDSSRLQRDELWDLKIKADCHQFHVSLIADKYASTIVQRVLNLRFGLQVMDTLNNSTQRIQWIVLSTLLYIYKVMGTLNSLTDRIQWTVLRTLLYIYKVMDTLNSLTDKIQWTVLSTLLSTK